MSARSAVFAALFVAAGGAGADVWVREDADGVLHITDRRPDPSYRLLVRDGAGYTAEVARSLNAPENLSASIERAARDAGLDPLLVHAVVRVESAYRPGAVSPKGAAGLMQLMPATAKRFGVTDRFSVEDNLRGGTRYLRALLDQFDGELPLALAAYNAGEGAVMRFGRRIPPYPESRTYVERVQSVYSAIRGPG